MEQDDILNKPTHNQIYINSHFYLHNSILNIYTKMSIVFY